MKINDFLCERESAGGRIKAFQFILKFVYALFLQTVASASHCTTAPPLHCPRLAWPCSSTCHPSLKMPTTTPTLSDGGAGVWMCAQIYVCDTKPFALDCFQTSVAPSNLVLWVCCRSFFLCTIHPRNPRTLIIMSVSQVGQFSSGHKIIVRDY